MGPTKQELLARVHELEVHIGELRVRCGLLQTLHNDRFNWLERELLMLTVDGIELSRLRVNEMRRHHEIPVPG